MRLRTVESWMRRERRRFRLGILAIVLPLMSGCSIGAGGAVASQELDKRARETLRALASSDSAALDSLVLRTTRVSESFSRVAMLAKQHFPPAVSATAKLVGSEVAASTREGSRYRVSYSFDSDSAAVSVDLWFVVVNEHYVVETIDIAGRKRP